MAQREDSAPDTQTHPGPLLPKQLPQEAFGSHCLATLQSSPGWPSMSSIRFLSPTHPSLHVFFPKMCPTDHPACKYSKVTHQLLHSLDRLGTIRAQHVC